MLGVWMWPESIRLRGADAVFEACGRAGVTDVFFLTKGLAGTAAFLTELTPPMEPGRDMLREALDAAHGRNMRLHAWFTSASDGHYKKEHPESGLFHYKNGRNRDIVSITHPGYIAYMRSVLSDMLRRYDVDGVHLDYIRYNHLIYGWSEQDQARYAAEGVNLSRVRRLMDQTFCCDSPDGEAIFDAFRNGDPDAVLLARARRKDVNAFAAALAEVVRGERSDATLSAALMPEGAYDDLAFADLHYGQNYRDLSALMDLFLPMAYSGAYGQDPEWVRRVARGTTRCGVATAVGLHAYEGATGVTLRRDLDAAEKEPGLKGVCLFREGAFVWAFADGRRLTLENPLAEPVTGFAVGGPDGRAFVSARVEPGARRDFSLPFAPDAVQAYAGENEACVFTARET